MLLPPPGPADAPRPERALALARTAAVPSGSRAHPTGGGRMSSVWLRSEAAFAAAESGPRPPWSAAMRPRPGSRAGWRSAAQPVPKRSPTFGTARRPPTALLPRICPGSGISAISIVQVFAKVGGVAGKL